MKRGRRQTNSDSWIPAFFLWCKRTMQVQSASENQSSCINTIPWTRYFFRTKTMIAAKTNHAACITVSSRYKKWIKHVVQKGSTKHMSESAKNKNNQDCENPYQLSTFLPCKCLNLTVGKHSQSNNPYQLSTFLSSKFCCKNFFHHFQNIGVKKYSIYLTNN